MWKVYLCSVFLAISMLACRKKPDPVVLNPGSSVGNMSLTFQNVAGPQPLVLNSGWYQNANGDSFQVSMYKYYVSNIKLVKEDGTEFAEVESYHLVDEASSGSKFFTIKDIPAGSYKSVKFMLGVDEGRNTSGAQTGALDPVHGMFWDWNTGYIMAKLEGISPQSTAPEKRITYHTGGFSGENSVLRQVSLNFPQLVQVKNNSLPNVHIKANILEWFQTPNLIKISDLPTAMSGDILRAIADNYSDMFTVDHID